MKLAAAAAAALALLAHHARPAHAIAACGGISGWAPTASEVPTRAHLIYFGDRLPTHLELIATIDGKPVKASSTPHPDEPSMRDISIDSDAVGKLVVKWNGLDYLGSATFTINPKLAAPKDVHATLSHFHHEIPHSTVREVYDGLAITLDGPAMFGTVRWRRDAQTPWSTLELPVVQDNGKPTLELGELGCHSNFSVPLLTAGVEMTVTVTFASGAAIAVTGVPAKVTLPK